jgi:hypothetical protein
MYEVTFSGNVIDALRALILRNPRRKNYILAALKVIEYRLQVFPQFGQELNDLSIPGAKLWVGVVPPLVVHYIVVERDKPKPMRHVSILKPLVPLPYTGIV